jgi:protein MpaA
MKWMLLTLVIAMAGCAANYSNEVSSLPPAPPRPNVPAANGTIIGYSVQHRPIEMFVFGAGERPVVVMGAIHGNEPTSESVARGLLDELRRTPQSASGVPVAVLPVANPDGLAAKTRTNANRIDLNRNFPAANWKQRSRARNSFGGDESASEPETTALMATINRLQPRLIISVHSIDTGKHCNNYDGPAKAIAELMSRYNGYPASPTIGYPTPGSLGSWAGIDRKIPMITLELPRSLPANRAWITNRDAILSAIGAMR